MDDDYPQIFVISLQKRQERRDHIKNEFENNNIKNYTILGSDTDPEKFKNHFKNKNLY